MLQRNKELSVFGTRRPYQGIQEEKSLRMMRNQRVKTLWKAGFEKVFQEPAKFLSEG
jgi:hypothetical protein